jgi:ubiquitin C-terminal hydrolase
MNNPFESRLLTSAVGLPNGGADANYNSNVCYFNSLVQCLLSLPSFIRVLEKVVLERMTQNKLVIEFYQIYLDMKTKPRSQISAGAFLDYFINECSKRKVGIRRGAQSDAHEALNIILELMQDIQSCTEVFLSRQRIYHLCMECNHLWESIPSVDMVHYMQADRKISDTQEQLDQKFKIKKTFNDYLKRHSDIVDGIQCPKNPLHKKQKYRIENLTLASDVIIVYLKNYTFGSNNRDEIKYPNQLTFTRIGDQQTMVYELCAVCVHQGTQQGGHYFAHGRRSNGWYTLNDSSTNRIDYPAEEKNATMLFYHYMGTR